MLILPAIDILGGRCVRLTQGDYGRQKVYDEHPAEVAKAFEQAGATMLHVVDLDGAKAGQPLNLGVIEAIAAATRLPLQVGGGIRSLEGARLLLDRGASRVVVGTKLVENPDLAERMLTELGERVVAGVDARDGKVSIHGWTEGSELDAVEFARRMELLGARRIIFTDIARDGMLEGPNLDALQSVASSLRIPLIASGGVSTLEEIKQLSAIKGIEAAIVGKALYEGRFELADAIQAATA